MVMPEWQPAASFGKRLEAFALTLLLLIVTLGVGWLAWSVFECRSGRTPSYRLLGLRVVRRSDQKPIGLCRSLIRSGICCSLLVLPMVVVCAMTGVCFAMGASPPDGLFRTPRSSPWDWITATMVIDDRDRPLVDPKPSSVVFEPIDLSGAWKAPRNGRAA
jgi:RDD family